VLDVPFRSSERAVDRVDDREAGFDHRRARGRDRPLSNLRIPDDAATSRGRRQLRGIEDVSKKYGFKYGVQTLLSFGGLTSIDHPRLHETLVSGPVGGVSGGRYICSLLGIENAILTDMGGTSFDMGVITAGSIPIEPEPVLARFKLNLPTLGMESIGAGSGTIIKIDPQSGKIQLGPESAGSTPGPICFDRGGIEPTVCDCDLILGYLNPDNFLGGRLKLNKPKALEALVEKVAQPLGVDVYAAAEGIVAVEMEAAALYAFAQARAKPVVCFAHVTNRMGSVEHDFEKGDHAGSRDALRLIVAAANAWLTRRPRTGAEVRGPG